MSTAKALYKGFRGVAGKLMKRTGLKFGRRWITRPGALNIKVPTELMTVGICNAIEYDTVRDGESVKARHVFAPGSRPVLLAGNGPGELFLVGDRFQMTDRGIVDQDARGRSVDYDENTRRTVFLHPDD